MANYNLTSQQLKDTYEQLVQVSGSALVNGTGSLVNAFDYPSNSTYNSFSSSVASTLSTIVAGSGSADWTLITNKPAGLVSGSSQVIYSQITGVPSGILSSSAQIATNISGAFTSTSASIAANIATNTSDISTKLATSTFTSYSSSVSTRLTTDESNISTNTSNISTQTSRVDSLVAATSSYAVKNSNNTFTGTQTFANIAVSGTASIAYLEQVTGSAVIIGEEFIILNTAVPAARYAGMKVYDTGSTAATASFLFDGLTNDWFYQYTGSDATNYGIVLFGPEYDTIGNPSYPTSNVIQKGMGGHHLVDSNISDDGSQVSITGPVSASTYYGDGSNLTGISVGLISATGSYSIQSNPSLVAPQTTFVSSSSAIGIGAVRVTGEESIGIGYIVTSSAANSFALGNRVTSLSSGVVIGYNLRHAGGVMNIGNANSSSGAEAMVVGSSAKATGTNTTAIGYQAQAITTNATAIGYGSYANGVNSTAIGNSDAGGVNALSIGEGANASNTNTTAIGVAASAGGDESVAIGTAFGVNGANALGIGRRGTSSGDSSIAIGSLTEATANNAIAIGNSVTATSSNAINIGNIFQYNGVSSINLVGSVTSSIGFKGDGSGLTNLNVVSSSYAVSSSFSSTSAVATTATSATTALTASSANSFLVRSELELSGSVSSEVTTLSIASSTASVDLSTSNFFEKSLTAPTFLANPTNAKPGSTYTFKFDSGSLITNYGTDYLFVDGTNPTLSNGQDIVTFVSFLSGSAVKLYGTGLANFS